MPCEALKDRCAVWQVVLVPEWVPVPVPPVVEVLPELPELPELPDDPFWPPLTPVAPVEADGPVVEVVDVGAEEDAPSVLSLLQAESERPAATVARASTEIFRTRMMSPPVRVPTPDERAFRTTRHERRPASCEVRGVRTRL
jgi:hypothetical protein